MAQSEKTIMTSLPKDKDKRKKAKKEMWYMSKYLKKRAEKVADSLDKVFGPSPRQKYDPTKYS